MKLIFLLLPFAFAACALAASDPAAVEAQHLKVFIAPMNGLETYISAAIIKKNVPVTITVERGQADLVLDGTAESQKAGWAKILVAKDARSTEEISIRLIGKDGTVRYAYSYHMGSSYHGKQSAAESCAKHLGEFLKKGQH